MRHSYSQPHNHFDEILDMLAMASHFSNRFQGDQNVNNCHTCDDAMDISIFFFF